MQTRSELDADLLRHRQHVASRQRCCEETLDLAGKVIKGSTVPVDTPKRSSLAARGASEEGGKEYHALEGGSDILEEFLHPMQDSDKGVGHGYVVMRSSRRWSSPSCRLADKSGATDRRQRRATTVCDGQHWAEVEFGSLFVEEVLFHATELNGIYSAKQLKSITSQGDTDSGLPCRRQVISMGKCQGVNLTQKVVAKELGEKRMRHTRIMAAGSTQQHIEYDSTPGQRLRDGRQGESAALKMYVAVVLAEWKKAWKPSLAGQIETLFFSQTSRLFSGTSDHQAWINISVSILRRGGSQTAVTALGGESARERQRGSETRE